MTIYWIVEILVPALVCSSEDFPSTV